MFLTVVLGIVIVFSYAAMAGFTYQLGLSVLRSRCNRSHDAYSSCEHEFQAFWASILWPIALPAGIAMVVTSNATPDAKSARRAAEQKKELKEARHAARLAEEKARATEALDREWRAATRSRQEGYDDDDYYDNHHLY